MSEVQRVGEWMVQGQMGWLRVVVDVGAKVFLVSGWEVRRARGAVIARGPETGDLGKAHADAALCEHGLVPWPCAACGGDRERAAPVGIVDTMHRDYASGPSAPGPRVPLCAKCGAWAWSPVTIARDIAARALYADGTPLLAAWLRASEPKVAPKPAPPAPRCSAGHALATADAPCATCAEDHRRAAERLDISAKADAARRARLADPVVRADLASLPAALRACADEVERSPLAMMPIATSRAVAARLLALAVEVASRQEQDGYVWAGCHYVSDRSYPHERLGLVYAHRIAPSDYVALQLASWVADIPEPADPWAGWTRTSATDAAKAGAK